MLEQFYEVLERKRARNTLTLRRACRVGKQVYGVWLIGSQAFGLAIEESEELLPQGKHIAQLHWEEEGSYFPHYKIIGVNESYDAAIVPSPYFTKPPSETPEYLLSILTLGEDTSLLQNKGHMFLPKATELEHQIDVNIQDCFLDETSPTAASQIKGMIASGLRVN